jgi:ankyrin repeat protein
MNKANNVDSTPAHAACRYGQLKCLLAKRGADLNKKDALGYTPLDIARACKHLECIDLLLASGVIGIKECLPPVRVDQKVGSVRQSSFCVRQCVFALSLYYFTHSFTLSGTDHQDHKRCKDFPEECQTMRLASVSGECRGSDSREVQEMSWVQSGGVLQQGARGAALSRAREFVRRADSDLRPPEVQGASRHRYQVPPVQGGDVLQQEAQVEARVGARGQVRRVVRVQIGR